LGESGTGKEVCARALHQLSPRAQAPFVAVNCAALPESILEAELFRRREGRIHRAVERRLGRFGESQRRHAPARRDRRHPPSMQVKLLRVLQEGEIERLGGSGAVHVDVRVVAATHVDLKERVKSGAFREDLYYRFDVITLSLPALRERDGDIPVLAMHFLKRMSERHKKNVGAIEPRALDALSSWTSRQRARARKCRRARRGLVPRGHAAQGRFPDQFHGLTAAPSSSSQSSLTFRVGQTLEAIERAAIDAAQTYGRRQRSRKLLGVSLRTLYRRARATEEAGIDDDG